MLRRSRTLRSIEGERVALCGLILSAPNAQPHITLPRARRTNHYGPHTTAVPYPSFLILICFLHFSPVASASDYQIHHDAHPSYLSSTLHLASHRTPAPKVNPQPQRPPHSASDHDGGRSCCCDPGRCAGVMARQWMRVLVATLVFAGTGEPFCDNRK